MHRLIMQPVQAYTLLYGALCQIRGLPLEPFEGHCPSRATPPHRSPLAALRPGSAPHDPPYTLALKRARNRCRACRFYPPAQTGSRSRSPSSRPLPRPCRFAYDSTNSRPTSAPPDDGWRDHPPVAVLNHSGGTLRNFSSLVR